MFFIIYGFGVRGKRLFNVMDEVRRADVLICDKKMETATSLENYPSVIRLENIQKYYPFQLCITLSSTEQASQVKNEMIERGIDESAFVDYWAAFYAAVYSNNLFLQRVNQYSMRKNNQRKLFIDCIYGLGLGGTESWSEDVCEFINHSNETTIALLTNSDGAERAKGKTYIDVINNSAERWTPKSILKYIDAVMDRLPCTIITNRPDDLLIAATIVKQVYARDIAIIAVVHGGTEEIYCMYKPFVGKIDRICGVSREICENIIAKGFSELECKYLPLPFICKAEMDREYSKESEPIRIGYAGRLDVVQKRTDRFVQLALILMSRSIPFVFNFVGDGPYYDKLKEQLETIDCMYSMKKSVPHEKVLDFWEQQDVCVNLSEYEGRSLMVLEAMGCGVVPVVTDVSGTHDDIIHGENGFIEDDIEKMADIIGGLYNRKDVLLRMGKKSRESVLKKSMMSTHVSDLLHVVKESESDSALG